MIPYSRGMQQYMGIRKGYFLCNGNNKCLTKEGEREENLLVPSLENSQGSAVPCTGMKHLDLTTFSFGVSPSKVECWSRKSRRCFSI